MASQIFYLPPKSQKMSDDNSEKAVIYRKAYWRSVGFCCTRTITCPCSTISAACTYSCLCCYFAFSNRSYLIDRLPEIFHYRNYHPITSYKDYFYLSCANPFFPPYSFPIRLGSSEVLTHIFWKEDIETLKKL